MLFLTGHIRTTGSWVPDTFSRSASTSLSGPTGRWEITGTLFKKLSLTGKILFITVRSILYAFIHICNVFTYIRHPWVFSTRPHLGLRVRRWPFFNTVPKVTPKILMMNTIYLPHRANRTRWQRDKSDFFFKEGNCLIPFFLSPLNQLLRGRLFPEQEAVWKERWAAREELESSLGVVLLQEG